MAAPSLTWKDLGILGSLTVEYQEKYLQVL